MEETVQSLRGKINALRYLDVPLHCEFTNIDLHPLRNKYSMGRTVEGAY